MVEYRLPAADIEADFNQEAVEHFALIRHQRSTLDAIRRVVDDGNVETHDLRSEIGSILDLHGQQLPTASVANRNKKNFSESLKNYMSASLDIKATNIENSDDLVEAAEDRSEYRQFNTERDYSVEDLDECVEEIKEHREGQNLLEIEKWRRELVKRAEFVPSDEFTIPQLRELVFASEIDDDEINTKIQQILTSLNASSVWSPENKKSGPTSWEELREDVDQFFVEMDQLIEYLDQDDTHEFKRDSFMVFLESRVAYLSEHSN